MCHVTCDTTCKRESMIKSFKDKRTRELYVDASTRRMPSDIAKRVRRKLEFVDYAATLDDLRVPPSNKLHALHGDRRGQWAIWVNDQWRICFTFRSGDAFDVELVDYH